MPQRKHIFWAASIILGSIFHFAYQPANSWSQAQPEVTVYVDRAVLAYEEKRFEEALKELQEALRLDPESIDALYYQGLVLIGLNRPADAQANLEKAAKLRPTDVDVAFQLGILYFNQQQYENAEPSLRQVYQAEPRRPNLGYYLGFMEYRKKNYREALRFFQAAVPSDEKFAQLARFYSGLAMSAIGFAREARVAIEEALRLQPVSPLTTPAQRFGEVLETAAQREKRFRGNLRLGVYYDTNVPVTPNSSTDIVASALRGNRERRKSEGELVTLELVYVWLRSPDWPDWEGTISHRFLQTYNNHLPEFNTQSHTPSFAITNRGSIGDLPYFAGLEFTYDFIGLGNLNKVSKSAQHHNKRFTQRWIATPYFTLQEKPFTLPAEAPIEIGNLTNLQYRFQVKDFFNDRDVIRQEVRDALNYMGGLRHFFLFDQGRHNINLGYQYDFEAAEGEDWTYRGYRLLAGVQYTLPWGDIRLVYNLDLHWRFYTNRNSLIPATAPGSTRRRDREPLHQASIAKDFSTDFSKSFPFLGCDSRGPCPFTVSVDYLFDNNKSNLAPFEYDRHVVTTSLTWRF